MLRLLFDTQAIALFIKLCHAISLRIAYSITKYSSFVILLCIYYSLMQHLADQRGMNEEELLDILEQLTDMTKEFDSFDDWQKQKEKYLKELQRAMEKQRTKGEGVVLSTLHSSKGLEYDVVFLIDVNEKIMPYKKAVLDADLEEERRMFYVGMTRAKKQLYLFSVELLNNHSAEPSRFLKELQET